MPPKPQRGSAADNDSGKINFDKGARQGCVVAVVSEFTGAGTSLGGTIK